MNFGDIVGFGIYWEINDNIFKKYYTDIDDDHWNRIKNAALLLSDHNIGPKVLTIDEKDKIIGYEIVTPFDTFDPPTIPEMNVQDIRNTIVYLVDKLHSLGYGHGDLHINNLGYKDNNIYLLDHDTIYNIQDFKDGKTVWLEKWMDEAFDDINTAEEFIATDYDGWNTDWLHI